MFLKRQKFYTNKKGFTLVELLIAVALFVTIATFAMGAVLAIFDANRNARFSKTVVDNLNISIENMARTVRFGTRYHCDSGSGSVTFTNDCSTSGGSRIAVLYKGETIVYRWNGTINDPLEISTNSGVSYSPITSPDTKIEYVRFYVNGSSVGDNSQPYIIAIIKGYVGNRPTLQSDFNIQTMMSQRKLDI